MSRDWTNEQRTLLATRLTELKTTSLRTRRSEAAIERDLLVSKWPGYHFRSPHRATMHFAKLYRESAATKFAEEFGQNTGRVINGYNDTKLDQSGREYSSMNKARQLADGLGIRYEVYLSICYEFWFSRQRPRIPRPNQLGPVGRYAEAWLRFCERKLEGRLSELFSRVDLEPYRLERNQNLPAQRAFRDLAVRYAKQPEVVGTYRDRIMALTIRERVLPVIRFRRLMKSHTYKDFLEELEKELRDTNPQRTPIGAAFEVDMMQSCCGLPGARDPSSAPCMTCAHSPACARLAESVEYAVMRATGAADPRLEHKRAGDRVRQAKCRAKKREAKAAA